MYSVQSKGSGLQNKYLFFLQIKVCSMYIKVCSVQGKVCVVFKLKCVVCSIKCVVCIVRYIVLIVIDVIDRINCKVCTVKSAVCGLKYGLWNAVYWVKSKVFKENCVRCIVKGLVLRIKLK